MGTIIRIHIQRGIRAKWTHASFIILFTYCLPDAIVRCVSRISFLVNCSSYLNYYYYYYCRESCAYIFIIYTISAHIIIILLYIYTYMATGSRTRAEINGERSDEDEDLSLQIMTLLFILIHIYYIMLNTSVCVLYYIRLICLTCAHT